MKLSLGAVALVAALALAGCAGSDTSPADGDTTAKKVTSDENEEVSNDDIKAVFEAISSGDPDEMEAVEKFVAPGSVAAAYLAHQRNSANASIDGGISSPASTLTKVEGGFKDCDGSGEENSCVVWADLKTEGGKLASLTVNDVELDDRITVGDGSTTDVGDLAEVEFLSAYKSIQGDQIFVNVRVTSLEQPITMNLYTATYRGSDKRQRTAVDALGNTDLDPDSSTYATMIFEAKAVGGEAKLDISDQDFNQNLTATVKTG